MFFLLQAYNTRVINNCYRTKFILVSIFFPVLIIADKTLSRKILHVLIKDKKKQKVCSDERRKTYYDLLDRVLL